MDTLTRTILTRLEEQGSPVAFATQDVTLRRLGTLARTTILESLPPEVHERPALSEISHE